MAIPPQVIHRDWYTSPHGLTLMGNNQWFDNGVIFLLYPYHIPVVVVFIPTIATLLLKYPIISYSIPVPPIKSHE